MRASIFAFSRQGCQTARKIMAVCPDEIWQSFTMERFEEPDFFDFMEDSEVVEKIDVHIKEEIYTVYPSRVHL